MTRRLLYVDTTMLDKMSWILMPSAAPVNNLTRSNSKSDYRLVTLLKLIYPLTRQPLNYTKLYYESGIRFKKSFIRYLKLCMDLGFIAKTDRSGHMVYYRITEKAQRLLDMFYIR